MVSIEEEIWYNDPSVAATFEPRHANYHRCEYSLLQAILEDAKRFLWQPKQMKGSSMYRQWWHDLVWLLGAEQIDLVRGYDFDLLCAHLGLHPDCVRRVILHGIPGAVLKVMIGRMPDDFRTLLAEKQVPTTEYQLVEYLHAA